MMEFKCRKTVKEELKVVALYAEKKDKVKVNNCPLQNTDC